MSDETQSSDVLKLLQSMNSGDPYASDELLPLVYDSLRRLAASQLARESPNQTLQATALVHEAYLRLIGNDESNLPNWDSRGHFYGAAARAMRQILVENARRKGRVKHGGEYQRIEMDGARIECDVPDDELLAVNEALNELAEKHPKHAKLVELRYFAGMTVDEAAAVIEVAPITAKRHWRFARAWLHDKLKK